MSNFLTSFDAEKATNKKCWQRFLELGLPTKDDEDFQYLALSGLGSYKRAETAAFDKVVGPSIVFVNGYFRPDLSECPRGCQLLLLSQAFKSYSALLNNRYNKLVLDDKNPFTLLNASQHQDGAFLYIPPKCLLDEPIKVVTVSTQNGAWIMPRLHMFMGRLSEAKVVISSHGEAQDAFYNAVFDFELEDEAKLSLAQTDFGSSGFRFDSFRATLKRHSIFRAVTLTDGAKRRVDFRVQLAGEAAETDLSGIWYLDGKKEAHTNIAVEHMEPHTRSLQLFKGVLFDEALSSFQGKIQVAQKAQKTQAYQLNNNLILSSQAQANSKPNLEIFADDVKASHGATVGQLDLDELFYLKTRGINEESAKKLLIRGFLGEVLAKLEPFEIETGEFFR